MSTVYDAEELAKLAVYDHYACQKWPELQDLIDHLADLQIERVLEIGAQEGGTFWLWSQLALPHAQLMTIDIETSKFMVCNEPEQDKYMIYPGDSATSYEIARNYLGEVDLLFIDGDHSYQGVKRDFTLYRPLVRPGGVVIFHDIVQHATPEASSVDRVWAELDNYPGRWSTVYPHAIDIATGILPAASCGIGVMRV